MPRKRIGIEDIKIGCMWVDAAIIYSRDHNSLALVNFDRSLATKSGPKASFGFSPQAFKLMQDRFGSVPDPQNPRNKASKMAIKRVRELVSQFYDVYRLVKGQPKIEDSVPPNKPIPLHVLRVGVNPFTMQPQHIKKMEHRKPGLWFCQQALYDGTAFEIVEFGGNKVNYVTESVAFYLYLKDEDEEQANKSLIDLRQRPTDEHTQET